MPHSATGLQRFEKVSEASCVTAERFVTANHESGAQGLLGQQEGDLLVEELATRLLHNKDTGRGWRGPRAKPLTDDDSIDPAAGRSVGRGGSQTGGGCNEEHGDGAFVSLGAARRVWGVKPCGPAAVGHLAL